MRKFTQIYNKMNGIVMDDDKEPEPPKDPTRDLLERMDKLNDLDIDL